MNPWLLLRSGLGLVVLFAAQWMLRLGARDGALVAWDCGGGSCATNDFAGAAPMLGAVLAFTAAYLLLPKRLSRLTGGLGMVFVAACVITGLEEAVAQGNTTRDGDSYFFVFSDLSTRSLEYGLVAFGLLGAGLALWLTFKGPQPDAGVPETGEEPQPGEEAALAPSQTALLVAELTKLHTEGRIDGDTYDKAVARLTGEPPIR